MAIDESSPTPTRGIGISGSPEGLRGLLEGYAGVLATIDDSPVVVWTKLDEPRLLRWVRVPAPRALARSLVVRHVSRCVCALERCVARRAALADDEAPVPQRDLKMLEQFENSLPPALRLALIWPLALLGTLLVAYILSNFAIQSDSSKLLADLTQASVNLDRRAAIDAFKSANFEPRRYLVAATIIAYSFTLVIVPLLPAFAVKRRLLAQLDGLEAQGFTALGGRRVHDLELDLLAQLVLVIPVAVTAGIFGWKFRTILIVLMVFAVVELRTRYAVRRGIPKRGHGRLTRLTRLSLPIVQMWSLGLFIFAVAFASGDLTPKVFDRQVGERGALPCQIWESVRAVPCEMEFTVTAIQQNAACADPYRPLKPGQQFLRFDLDVSSTVDRFSDPEIANVLSLRHWRVAGSDGVLEQDAYMYTKCGDGAENISQPIVPGSHTKTVVVINAPKPATLLQLDVPHYKAWWRWRIPPAGG
ncbi:hypothetical protein A5641_00750 [Mycobacterium sp. 1554424.7]|nr:hypothetical protein A5641_00750 [Mycobacterium sp. 1554424.7]